MQGINHVADDAYDLIFRDNRPSEAAKEIRNGAPWIPEYVRHNTPQWKALRHEQAEY